LSIPFGFSPGESNSEDLAKFFENLSQLMQNSDKADSGPVNWKAVEQTSSAVLHDAGDPAVDSDFKQAALSASDLADLWLNEATSLPSGGEKCEVLTRGQWIAQTLLAWQSLVNPVAQGLTQAMATIIPAELDTESLAIPPEVMAELPPEIASQMEQLLNSGELGKLIGPIMDLAKSMGATLFGNQFGHGLGVMATKVLSGTDVGIPLTKSKHPSYIAANVKEFNSGLNLELSDTLIFLALRELAHQRLFTAAPWLQSHIQSAMSDYSSGVQIDTSAIEQALSEIDPTDMDAVNAALSGDLFVQSRTPEQIAALERLELLLALIESWVATVVTEAVGNRLPSSGALAETLRRRRAAGGPAEKFFEGIIGLEIRPRKIREAAVIWQTLTERIGLAERDKIWSHPDLLPTSTDLEDIDVYLANQSHDLMTDLQNWIDEQKSAEDSD